MKLKLASGLNLGHVIVAIIILVLFVLTIGDHISAEGFKYEFSEEDNALGDVPLTLTVGGFNLYKTTINNLSNEIAGPLEQVTVEVNYFDMFLNDYQNDVVVLSKALGLDSEEVINNLRELYNSEEFEITNVGYLRDKDGNLIKFDSVQLGIFEYLQNYVDEHPESVSKKRVPYTGNAKYVESLIIYFTKNIYTNVDTNLALSIGAAESGYYTVSYMLKCNNIYGGMGSSGLIKYNSIENGVYRYVRYLSLNYMSKGITSLEGIGRIYCPGYNSSGARVASPHWISLVTRAQNYYNSYNMDVTATSVLESR